MKPNVSFMINSFFENIKIMVMNKWLDIQNQWTESKPLKFSNTVWKGLENAIKFQRDQKEWSAKEKQFFINTLWKITKDYLWLKRDILKDKKYWLKYSNHWTDGNWDYFYTEAIHDFVIN